MFSLVLLGYFEGCLELFIFWGFLRGLFLICYFFGFWGRGRKEVVRLGV